MRWTVLLALAIAAATRAQGTEPEPGRTVRIDLVATDAGGRPVDNLEAADFEVMADGVPLRIDGVRLVTINEVNGTGAKSPAASANDKKPVAADDVRVFGIFLDEYHIGATFAGTVRAALLRLVEQDLGPRDLVAVVKSLDSLVALKTTSDRDAVRRTIASLEGRKGDYAARSPAERNLFAGAPAHIELARTQVALSALNALAGYLGGVNGARKTLVLVSEGFELGRPARGDEPLPTIEGVIRAANRGNVSIYPIDPRAYRAQVQGVAPDMAWSAADQRERLTLSRLAASTAGAAILDHVDRLTGLQRMANDSGAFYMISCATASGLSPGSFHPVQVRVARRGVTVRARSGFWTLSPDELAANRRLEAALVPKAPPGPAVHASLLIRPWFGQAPQSPGRTRVTFVWEPASRLTADRQRTGAPERLALKVTTDDGTPVFDGRIQASDEAAVGDGATTQATFDAAPGRLRLQMRIEDHDAHLLDTDVRELLIEAPKGEVVLGTPAVVRTRTARQFRAAVLDPAATPVASREFSRTERLLIRVPIYTARSTPTLNARLRGRSGSAMRDLTIDAGPAPATSQIDLPLAGLAPGDYSVEVSVDGTSAAGTRQVVAFRVTS